MKRKLLQLTSILAISIVFLFLCSIATAGIIGNPIGRTKQGSFLVCGELDLVTRDWKDENDEAAEIKSNRYLVRGTYGINDTWDVYMKLGMASMQEDDSNFEGDSQLAYGIGVNGTVYTNDKLKIGTGLQIFSAKSEEEENGATAELSGLEYEVACAGTYEGLGDFIPYGGLLLSKINGKSEVSILNTTVEDDLEEDALFGLFVGGEYFITPQVNVGAEMRLVSETSFSLMFNYSF